MRLLWTTAIVGLAVLACDGDDPLADDTCVDPVHIEAREGLLILGDTITMTAVRTPCGISVIEPAFSWEEFAGQSNLALAVRSDSSVLITGAKIGFSGVNLMGAFMGQDIQVLDAREIRVVAVAGAPIGSGARQSAELKPRLALRHR